MNASVLLVMAKKIKEGTAVRGAGSATVVRWGGKPCVVTAWHVVKGTPRGFLQLTGNGHTQRVGPFKKVDGRDLAWVELKVMPTNWHLLEVAGNNKDHAACVAWGFPGTTSKLESHRCTDRGWVEIGDDKARWFMGAAIPGMSGGPILDDDNRVVGVVSKSQQPYNKVFYAAPMCDIEPQ